MFKRVAHSSTLPALGVSSVGNKDLRPLQDLITSEKAILSSFQRLSLDVSKASENLRLWGSGEGDDLTVVLGAASALMGFVVQGLAAYAGYEERIRETMKNIRTREEGLDDMKRRRKTLYGRLDAAEKKLSKMGPENKNLQLQTELVNGLREELRQMDGDILVEEAANSDFKRACCKDFLGVKFAGLVELGQKAQVRSFTSSLFLKLYSISVYYAPPDCR
jgi:hypothetical protein